LRFALYHPWIYLAGGIERTIGQIVQGSRHEWTIYSHHVSLGSTFPELSGANIVALHPSISIRRSAIPLAKAAAVIASTRLPPTAHDGLLVSSEGFGDLIMARNSGLPSVCLCYTPLKILHDPVTRDRLVGGRRLRGAALTAVGAPFAAVDRRLWRRYRFVLAISEETRARISRAGLRPDDQVEVLHPGVDSAKYIPGEAHRAPVFLVAGRIMWQKNVELAIDAIADLKSRGLNASLIIAGAVDAKSQGYLSRLRARAADLPVQFEVNPDDRRLADLYGTSTALLFTPPSEDWGIVPLEAMASGTPVLAVAASGPTESVVDGKTGWLLPPDPVKFSDRMAEVIEDGSWLVKMRAAARTQAGLFTWGSFVARLDAVMEEVVSSAPSALSAGPVASRG